MKIQVEIFDAPSPSDFDKAFAAMAKKQIAAVMVQGDTSFTA